MNRSLLLTFLACMFSCCTTNWFNPNNELWEFEPEYLTVNTLDFGSELDSIDIHLFNNEGHHKKYQSVKYSIQKSDDWIHFSNITSGLLYDETIVTAVINRSIINEGINSGKVIATIDNKDYTINTIATGTANLVTSVDALDYGTSAIFKTIGAYSTIGTRRYFSVTSNNQWITVNPNHFYLSENVSGTGDNIQQIGITCSRNNVDEGKHEGSITITSDGGTFKKEVFVTMVIPKRDSITVTVDDFTFTYRKAPYRSSNDVIVELIIKNGTSIYKLLELNANSSFASDIFGNRYSINGFGSSDILPFQEATNSIIIKSVPDSINSMTSVELDFGLSDRVIFKDLLF